VRAEIDLHANAGIPVDDEKLPLAQAICNRVIKSWVLERMGEAFD